MSRTAHLARIQRLIRLHEATLLDLRAGRAPDVDRLAAERKNELDALVALGDVPPDAVDAEQIERALTRLGRLNEDLTQVMGELRDAVAEQLRGLGRGRQTLNGYQRIAAGSRRGNRLGEA